MTYNFTHDISTEKFEIKIDPGANYGYFEHNELGDERGGGLWFQGKELTDYDGVACLPSAVAKALRDAGYIVDPIFD